ncbi:hypothetical protein HK101_002649, partial [Irineochytrium annulatum]
MMSMPGVYGDNYTIVALASLLGTCICIWEYKKMPHQFIAVEVYGPRKAANIHLHFTFNGDLSHYDLIELKPGYTIPDIIEQYPQ